MEQTQNQNLTKLAGRELLSLLSIAAISSITFPFQMIRTRLQTASQLFRQGSIGKPYQGVFDCIKRIKQNEGKRAFWKGNFANVLRVIPNEAFNFFTKQSIQVWVRKHRLVSADNLSINFISGSIGAVFTLLFIYPLDFARSRLTNDISGKGSIKSYLVNTYQKQGFSGIYRGSINFFVSCAIFRALYFGIFDSFKSKYPNNLTTRIIGSYVGSITAMYIVYPFDTIRKRMMMTSGDSFKYGGFVSCTKYILQKEGLKYLYKGWQLSFFQAFGAAGCLFFLDSISTDLKRKAGIE